MSYPFFKSIVNPHELLQRLAAKDANLYRDYLPVAQGRAIASAALAQRLDDWLRLEATFQAEADARAEQERVAAAQAAEAAKTQEQRWAEQEAQRVAAKQAAEQVEAQRKAAAERAATQARQAEAQRLARANQADMDALISEGLANHEHNSNLLTAYLNEHADASIGDAAEALRQQLEWLGTLPTGEKQLSIYSTDRELRAASANQLRDVSARQRKAAGVRFGLPPNAKRGTGNL
jgi:hypothetical protein